MKFCECGCGKEVNKNNIYIQGHNNKGKIPNIETREKIKKSLIGKKFSEERKKKQSIITKKLWEDINYREKVMKVRNTVEVKKKQCNNIRIALNKPDTKRKRSLLNTGEKNPMYGKKWYWTKEQKEKRSLETRGKNNNMYGRTREKSPRWMGGIAFGFYGEHFNNEIKERIRHRDNKCMICLKSLEELKILKKRVDIHHIDYIKTNNFYENLICLCKACHMKTNYNRKYWESYFKILLIKEYNIKTNETQKSIINFDNKLNVEV